jgi:hypothetical protein
MEIVDDAVGSTPERAEPDFPYMIVVLPLFAAAGSTVLADLT